MRRGARAPLLARKWARKWALRTIVFPLLLIPLLPKRCPPPKCLGGGGDPAAPPCLQWRGRGGGVASSADYLTAPRRSASGESLSDQRRRASGESLHDQVARPALSLETGRRGSTLSTLSRGASSVSLSALAPPSSSLVPDYPPSLSRSPSTSSMSSKFEDAGKAAYTLHPEPLRRSSLVTQTLSPEPQTLKPVCKP